MRFKKQAINLKYNPALVKNNLLQILIKNKFGTQAKFAKKLKLSQTMVSRLVHGYVPNVMFALKLSKLFQIKIEELFNGISYSTKRDSKKKVEQGNSNNPGKRKTQKENEKAGGTKTKIG